MILSEQMLKEIVDGGKSIANVTMGTATALTNEAINLFIVESVLSLLKFSVVFIIFFIVKKYCDTLAEANKEKTNLFKAFKTTALVLSLIFFTTQSFPHIVQISKALVAPKIFLAEKVAEMVKK